MAKRRKAQDYLPFVAQSGYGIQYVFLGCLNLYLYKFYGANCEAMNSRKNELNSNKMADETEHNFKVSCRILSLSHIAIAKKTGK